jgi:exodeoxyribonuclease V gamma subunit
VAERHAPRPFLDAPLPPLPHGPLELTDLVRFAEHPVRAFLRQRLGISVGDYSDEVGDALPVELDALERWGVGQRLLDAVIAGTDGRTAIRAEIAAGKLPPGQLGKPVVDDIWVGVDEIAQQARALIAGEARSVDVKVDVAGRRLTGTVPGVRDSVLATITYSKVNPRHRIGAWVRLLALCATGEAYSSATIGRASGPHGRVTVARVPALSREAALAELEVLVDLYDRGMREPLPLACRTSAAFAAGGNPRGEWESDRFPKEDRDAEHELVYGSAYPFASLLEAPPRADEQWDPAEQTRFGQFARRLWRGLLAHETVGEA